MANADNALKARMGKLRKKADSYGLVHTPETTEEVLRLAIKEYEASMAPVPKAQKQEAPPAAEVMGATAEVLKQMQELAKTLKGDKSTEADGIVSEAEADPADQLPSPKVYFTPSSWWILPMKKVGGQHIKYPYKKIVFSAEHGRKIRNGMRENTQYLSAYRTNSRRESAYMETHELFGRLFFLSSKQAMILPENARKAIRFGKYLAQLNATPMAKIYSQAASMGITFSKEEAPTDIRTKLADALTEQEQVRENEGLKNILTQQGRQELLTQVQHT